METIVGSYVNQIMAEVADAGDGAKATLEGSIDGIEEDRERLQRIPLADRTRSEDDRIQLLGTIAFELSKILWRGSIPDEISEECDCDAYNHFVDLPLADELISDTEPLHNYPRLKHPAIGEVFNRRSVLLHIKWGKVQGKPTLRLTITRVKARGEEDDVLLQFDMPAEPDESGELRHPRQYIFQALKEAKRQFSDQVGCVICGKPDIWFKKIQTPQFPLYRVMFKEIDFADSHHRICRDCDKLLNRQAVEFNPVPELDDDGNGFDSIFADSVSEPYNIRKDLQFDNLDFRVALDVHASTLQLGG